MKNQKKNSGQPRFTLPGEVCEACGFQAEDAMSLHAGPGALVILPDRMKVMETANAIDTLSQIASDLTVALAKCAGLCDGCGQLGGKSPAECAADCSLCRDLLDEDQRVRVPDSLLEEADIPRGAKLEACAGEGSGEITVYEADVQQDVTDLPPGVLSVLAASGICLAELDERITLEDIVYGE